VAPREMSLQRLMLHLPQISVQLSLKQDPLGNRLLNEIANKIRTTGDNKMLLIIIMTYGLWYLCRYILCLVKKARLRKISIDKFSPICGI
jgi:hypothetical protein